MSADTPALDPVAALAAWQLGDAELEAITAGHINRTWRVDHARGRFALQRLNPIFDPALHHDIEAITAQLAAVGLETPRLVPTQDNALWHEDRAQGIWRLQTWIEGETLLKADSSGRCREAGRLLGEVHRALWDLDHSFHFTRLGVHDTARHLSTLQQALESHSKHENLTAVAPVAAEILRLADGLDLTRELPRRLVHGDPKISNVLFDPDGRARCLVDLDTLARMPIAVELGDAFRSWCNPAGEDGQASFDLEFFAAGLEGYADAIGALPGADETAAVPEMILTICVELAARFAADALNESYFNWDRASYPSASAHNLVRAQAQLDLARVVAGQRAELEHITLRTWSRLG